MSQLNKIALEILSNGKGILAADESTGTMTIRLEAVNDKSTAENRLTFASLAAGGSASKFNRFTDYLKFTNDFIMFLLILILFRFFDILKIFPINWVDKNIKNSFGVVLDDLLAGVYSIIVLYSINVFI